jgi:hypothetical protein
MLEPNPIGGGERTKYTMAWNIMNIPRPTTNAVTFVKRTFLLARTVKLIIGWDTRDSTKRKSAKKLSEMPRRPIVFGEGQPQFCPSVMVTRNAIIPIENVIAPK